MCGSFPGLLIGRTAVHSGKDPAFVAYDQFLSTGICNRSAGARCVVGHSRRYCHVRSHVRYHQQRTLCDISLDHLIGARSGCCVRAASGHAAAAPPSAASNSRRAMVTLIRPSRARCVRERYHATSVLSLTARHLAWAERLDFKRLIFGRAVGRALIDAGIGRMSALGANRTCWDGGNDVNDAVDPKPSKPGRNPAAQRCPAGPRRAILSLAYNPGLQRVILAANSTLRHLRRRQMGAVHDPISFRQGNRAPYRSSQL